MTRRKACRQEGLQNRRQGLRLESAKCTSHPGRSHQEKSESAAGRWPSHCGIAHGHGVSGVAGSRCFCCRRLLPLLTPRPVPLTLSLAFFPTVGGSPILPAGTPASPATSGRAALRATVPGLGMGGTKVLLASLEETWSLPRPTCPLTGPSLAACLMWAQGSCELPTAKPRTRSFLPPLRGAFLDHALLLVAPPIQVYDHQPRRPSHTGAVPAHWNPADYRLVPQSLEHWYPRNLLLTIDHQSLPRKPLNLARGRNAHVDRDSKSSRDDSCGRWSSPAGTFAVLQATITEGARPPPEIPFASKPRIFAATRVRGWLWRSPDRAIDGIGFMPTRLLSKPPPSPGSAAKRASKSNPRSRSVRKKTSASRGSTVAHDQGTGDQTSQAGPWPYRCCTGTLWSPDPSGRESGRRPRRCDRDPPGLGSSLPWRIAWSRSGRPLPGARPVEA